MTTYLITISSDTENIQMTIKNRSLEYAKDKARGLWVVIDNPRILQIKDLKDGYRVVFKHSEG